MTTPTETTAKTEETTVNVDRAMRVEQAVSKAVDLIRQYSERDPHDGDEENPWRNPQAMLDELDRARDDIVAAWQHGRDKHTDNESNDDTISASVVNENDFRAAYMDMITNAFADVLEDMRNSNSSEEELDVDILVDCLQSGMDFMSGEEKEFFMVDEKDDMLDDGPTPHEARRLQLGLHAF